MENQKLENYKWNHLPWRKMEQYVFRLQTLIYKASKENDIKKTRKLQRILLDSLQAKILATRKVTQDNTGKRTAGVDGIKSLDQNQRMELALNLSIPTKAKPVRRVWIPKPGTDEKRPLGIPILKDRALQALLKSVIEPEWEARFEPDSYGFRPGRGCHDAIKQAVNAIRYKPKYVLDADITKCFDRINHQHLLDKLGYTGRIRRQIKEWLKAGILDGDLFEKTLRGTPQGGVISPLLANTALHGLDQILQNYIATTTIRDPKGKTLGTRDKRKALSYIRYADDIRIIHESLEIVKQCKKLTETFLSNMGLELNPNKTHISHTLDPNLSETGRAGFNFLGFTIKQFRTKYRSVKHTREKGKLLGFRTLVYPSKESLKKHNQAIKTIINTRNQTQTQLIERLTPVIIGWTNYVAISDAYNIGIIQKCDYLLYLKLRKWARSKTGNNRRALLKYWKRDQHRWVFTDQEKTLPFYWEHASKKSITKYVKVKSHQSPFDGQQIYWAQRLPHNPHIKPSLAKLLRKQKGRCPICNLMFKPNDRMEVDHIIPKKLGGQNQYGNLQLLHKHCHIKKTGLKETEPMEAPITGDS